MERKITIDYTECLHEKRAFSTSTTDEAVFDIFILNWNCAGYF